MNEKLQAALADILKLLTDAASSVGTAAQTEIPLLVREILVYRWWEAVGWVCLAAIPMILLWTAGVKLARWGLRDDDVDTQFATFFGACMITAVSFIPASVVWTNILTAIKISVAPRLYLLEQVKELIK